MMTHDVLKKLQEIDGYLASAVFDKHGYISIKHNKQYDIEIISTHIITLFNKATIAANNASLGDVHFIQVNFESAVLSMIFSAENNSIVAVLLDAKGNAGLAKLALTEIIKQIDSMKN